MKKSITILTLLSFFLGFIQPAYAQQKNKSATSEAAVAADFNYTFLDSLTVQFNNLSQNATSYLWDFGDGSTYSTEKNPIHHYEYWKDVKACLTASEKSQSSTFCDSVHIIRFCDKLKASFTHDQFDNFFNHSQYASSYLWDFGDGQTSNEVNPFHYFRSSGPFHVTLTAYCNDFSDSASADVIYNSSLPGPYFYTDEEGLEVFFSNSSNYSTRYVWDFGDGNTSTEISPFHIYSELGIYNACLKAFNGANDSASYCLSIIATNGYDESMGKCWTRTDSVESASPVDMVIDKDGNVYVLMQEESTVSVIKYTQTGETKWRHTLKIPMLNNAYKLLQDVSGNLFVLASNVVVKLDATGKIIGHISIEGNVKYTIMETNLSKTGIYLLGCKGPASYVIKMDTALHEIWKNYFKWGIYAVEKQLAFDGNSNVFVLVNSGYNYVNNYLGLLKINDVGISEWNNSIGYDGYVPEGIFLRINKYNEPIIAASAEPLDHPQSPLDFPPDFIAIDKFSSDGNFLWFKDFYNLYGSIGAEIDSEGNIYWLSSDNLFKLDENGNTIWNRQLAYQNYYGLTLQNDAPVFVGSSDVKKFHSDGRDAWSASVVNFGARGVQYLLGVDSTGNVVVANRTGSYPVIVKYCDNGSDSCAAITYFKDADGDGYGDASNYTMACIEPLGYLINNTDCNDRDAAINPKARELCNRIDDNCNHQTDEGLPLSTFYADEDSDGYGIRSIQIESCTPPPHGYVSDHTDCDDSNATLNPGEREICGNDIDDNCNGKIDESCQNCKPPLNFTLSDITATSVTLHWSSMINATGYRIEYKVFRMPGHWRVHAKQSDTTKILKGLSPNTTYVTEMVATCGSFHSDISESWLFTTLSQKESALTDDLQNNFLIYPNPTTGIFILQLLINDQSINSALMEIHNAIGQMIYSKTESITNGELQTQIQLDASLPKGIYFVRVNAGSQLYNGKVLVQ